MRSLLFALALLFSWSTGFSQQSTATAYEINSLPHSGNYSTCKGGYNYDSSKTCQKKFSDGRSLFFRIKSDSTICTSINIYSFSSKPIRISAILTTDSLLLASGPCDNSVGPTLMKNLVLNVCFKKDSVYYLVVFSEKTKSETPVDCFDFNLQIPFPLIGPPPAPCEDSIISSMEFHDSHRFTSEGRNRAVPSSCNGYKRDGSKEYIYSYTARESDDCAVAIFKAKNQRVFASLYTDCPEASICTGNSIVAANDSVEFTMKLIPGRIYYFMVTVLSDGPDSAGFSFSLKPGKLKTEDCPNAELVTGNVYTSNFDYYCRAYPWDSLKAINGNLCTRFSQGKRTVFYKLSSPGNQCLTVTAQANIYPFNGKLQWFIVKGCPYESSAVCIAQSSYPYALTFLEDPGDYYVIFTADNNDAKFFCTFRLTEDQKDQRCVNPGSFTSFPVDQVVTIENCKGYYGNAPCIPASSFGVTYAFQVPETGCYDFRASGLPLNGTIVVSEKCPDQDSCINSAINQTHRNTIKMRARLEAGRTYLVTYTKPDAGTDILAHTSINRVDTAGECLECAQNSCYTCQYSSFETSDFTGWAGYSGTFSEPFLTNAKLSRQVNAAGLRFSITSSGEADPNIPEIPLVNPFSGEYSARIGDYSNGAFSETLRYTYTVEDNDDLFIYYYAVVLQDPGHNPEQQPYFEISITTEDGEPVECGNYKVSAGQNIPGFQSRNGFVYKNWSAVAVPVKDYRGKKITVQFQTKDCALGEHLGYAYIDAVCGNLGDLQDTICEGEPKVISAPEGFASYLWNTGETSRTVTYDSILPESVRVITFTGCTLSIRLSPVFFNRPDITTAAEIPCNSKTVRLKGQVPDNFLSGWELESGEYIPQNPTEVTYSNDGMHHASYVLEDRICRFKYPVSFKLFDQPEFEEIYACPDDTVVLSFKCDSCAYLWSTGSTDTSIYGFQPNSYDLTVFYPNGCVYRTQKVIKLKHGCAAIYVPNTFTVDGDELNETFRPSIYGGTIDVLEIFTRWGQLITKIPGPDPEWLGDMQLVPCKQDVYVWKLHYTTFEGVKGEKMGHVNLLR